MRLVLVLLALLVPVAATADAAPTARSAIVGGAPAADGAYPWTVALVPGTTALNATSTGGQFCGGTLVTPTRVLTAAHCTDGDSANAIKVVAGATDLRATGGRIFAVTAVSEYPSFRWSNGVPRNDVAVLELASPVPNARFLGGVEPSPSPDDELWAIGRNLTIVGWGQTSSGVASWRLLEASVPRRADADCASAFAGRPAEGEFAATEMFCAGGGTVDTCYGDSGGPILAPTTTGTPSATDPADWKIAGITSWGVACGAVGLPGVYTRVANRDFAAAFTARPQSQTPPALTGTAVEGERLSCDRGGWGGSPATFMYAFHRIRSGVASPARAASPDPQYTLGPDDVGASIVCLVTGRNAGGDAQAESAPAGPVAARPDRAAAEQPPPPVLEEQSVAPPQRVAPEPLGPPAARNARDDVAAPRAHLVNRRCRRGRCVLVVNVSDSAPSSGIADVTVRLRWRERGRTRRRTLSVRNVTGSLFHATTPALRRGRRYSVALVAEDESGNRQAIATIARFRAP